MQGSEAGGGGGEAAHRQGWLDGFRSGRWVAMALLAVYAGFFAGTLPTSPTWGPLSDLDEQLGIYQAARNIARFGFASTGFVIDVSTAADPALHPFADSRRPPAPAVLTALILEAAGEKFAAVRIVFALVFFLGLASYLRFADLVLGRIGLAGAGFTLLFLTPASLIHSMDHPEYAAFPLLAFLPPILLDHHYRTGRAWPLGPVVLLGVLSATALAWESLLMLLACWGAAGVLQVVRLERRHVAMWMGGVGLGVVARELPLLLFLGPALFVEQTAAALSSSILGVPALDTLRDLSRGIDTVPAAGHLFDVFALGQDLLSALRVAWPTLTTDWRVGDTTVTAGLLALVLVWGGRRFGRWNPASRVLRFPRSEDATAFLASARFLVALWTWAVVAIAVPILGSPASPAGYGVAGPGEYFLALGAAASYVYMVTAWARWRPRIERARLAPGMLALGLLAVMAAGAGGAIRLWPHQAWTTFAGVPEWTPESARLSDLERHRGEVVMTNASPAVVGFFTGEAVLGDCGTDVLSADGRIGDVTRCGLVPAKGFGRTTTLAPTRYVLFADLRDGEAGCDRDCRDALQAALAERYAMVDANPLYRVFDLAQARPVGRPDDGPAPWLLGPQPSRFRTPR